MNWDEMTSWERNMLVHTQVMGNPGGGIPEYTTDLRVAWLVLQKIASRYSEQSQWLVVEQFKEFVEELCECSGNEIYPELPLSAPGFSYGGEKGVPCLGLELGMSSPLDISNGL